MHSRDGFEFHSRLNLMWSNFENLNFFFLTSNCNWNLSLWFKTKMRAFSQQQQQNSTERSMNVTISRNKSLNLHFLSHTFNIEMFTSISFYMIVLCTCTCTCMCMCVCKFKLFKYSLQTTQRYSFVLYTWKVVPFEVHFILNSRILNLQHQLQPHIQSKWERNSFILQK